MRRPHLLANDIWRIAHFLPNSNCCCIHIQQPYLLTTFATKTIYANCGQEPYLPGCEQVRRHADSRRALDVLDVFCALCNDLIVKRNG